MVDRLDPCKCQICGVVISRRSDLRRHMKKHDPEDEFVLICD